MRSSKLQRWRVYSSRNHSRHIKIQTLTAPTKFFVYLGDQFSSSASEKYKPFYLEPSAWQRCPCNQLGTGIFHNHISGLRQHEQSSRATLANCTCICERVFIDASTAARWQMLTPTLTHTHIHIEWVSHSVAKILTFNHIHGEHITWPA